MAGLLKQLQKQETRFGESVSDVLIEPEDLVEEELDPKLVRECKLEAEQLLDDLLKETDELRGTELPEKRTAKKNAVTTTTSGVKFVHSKRHGSGSTKKLSTDDSLPRWRREEIELSDQGQALLAAALAEYASISGSAVDTVEERIEQAVASAVEGFPRELAIERSERSDVKDALTLLVLEKGPLVQLFADGLVSDILIERYDSIKAIRRGLVIETPFRFRSSYEYRFFLDMMLAADGRELSLATPIIDYILEDTHQSRVNIVHPSVSDGGEPRTCIRIPRMVPVSFYDILQTKTLPATAASWLAEVVATRQANVLVVGPLGSGKTVMTTCLLSAVASAERIITIEDTPEILISNGHLEKLLTRPADARGNGAVTKSDLLHAALARTPHRIVLGEMKEEEGGLFLRALENGYSGSISTLSADSAIDGLWRFLDVVARTDRTPQQSLIRRIARSVDFVVCMRRVDGSPCLIELAEVMPPTDTEFVTLPLVRYNGMVEGRRQWLKGVEDSPWLNRLEEEQGVSLNVGSGLVSQDAQERTE